MREFLFATSEGKVVKAEVDPRVGGRFLFVDRRRDDAYEDEVDEAQSTPW